MKTLEQKMTSLELVKMINEERKRISQREDSKYNELKHNDFLKIIRDEFEEEIREGRISFLLKTRELPNGGSKKDPYYILTLNQSKQLLVRESKYVRKAVIEHIEK